MYAYNVYARLKYTKITTSSPVHYELNDTNYTE